MLHEPANRWSINDALDLYNVPRWSNGYFGINESGHVTVNVDTDNHKIDLKLLIDNLQMRGLQLPILLRFNDLIRMRMAGIRDAFSHAIQECNYQGSYQCVYPIKVNQQRQVVEQIVQGCEEFGFGLEAGSKPELLAVIAMSNNEMPIICNGFKDTEFIEMALMAQKMGRQVLIVIEKYTELETILKLSKKLDVEPRIGARVKLAARGAGRWQSSGGFGSKFGLNANEIVRLVAELEAVGLQSSLKLLHFHLGSQITNIRYIKGALVEAARIYANLVKSGTGITYLDVGGGLGVDYDGSQTNFESSVNYTLQEYANDVVHYVQSVCDDEGVPHPKLISESGRATVAYHSVLVFEVLGTSGQGLQGPDVEAVDETAPQPLQELKSALESVGVRKIMEAYHDAQQALDTAINMFNLGHLTLQQRALAEQLFWATLAEIRKCTSQLEFCPEELEGLDRLLADTFFCNFSIFQSIPDSWAIKQLFPIMPIHRLEQKPTKDAILGDISCDSDGKIDKFIDCREMRRSLLLHEFDEQPYYLGAFLVGAYQEILGDLHNLFGDTNAVHINMSDEGYEVVDHVIRGNTVEDVLNYVQYEGRQLTDQIQQIVEEAVRERRIDHPEAGRFLRFYDEALSGYTYLESDGC